MDSENGITQTEVDEWLEDDEALADEATTIEDPVDKYARSQLRVVRETKDYQLDYLRHALRPGRERIDTSPTYQRRLRWQQKKRSLLIESFLLNIPVPPVYLFERDYNEYEVIDGRQRLETIRDFLANNFALTGLQYWPELNRNRFNDLPSILQKGLLRRSLPAVVLLAETRHSADDIDVRRILFDRLNTGGIRLNHQELRNALYPGPFNKLLITLARSTPFTTAWMIPQYVEGEEDNPPDRLAKNILFKSMRDAELVLRFFALRDAIENDRKGGLRRILDRFMDENANIDGVSLQEMEKEFTELLSRMLVVFKSEPFRIPGIARPSRPLYDALMIALSQNPDVPVERDRVNIRQRLRKALKDGSTYDVLVGRGNTIESIHERVSLATQILKGN